MTKLKQIRNSINSSKVLFNASTVLIWCICRWFTRGTAIGRKVPNAIVLRTIDFCKLFSKHQASWRHAVQNFILYVNEPLQYKLRKSIAAWMHRKSLARRKKFSTVSHQHARLPPKCLVFVQNVGWERFRRFLSLNRERLHLLAVSLRWKSYSSWKELDINAWKLAKMKKSSLNLLVQKNSSFLKQEVVGCVLQWRHTKKLKNNEISPSRTGFCF